VKGGAKALKNIDRGAALTKAQQTRLNDSLTTFVAALNGARREGGTGKFLHLSDVNEVQAEITRILVKRAGPAAQAQAPLVASVGMSASSSSGDDDGSGSGMSKRKAEDKAESETNKRSRTK
jgi:hypothetical protein